MKSQIKNIVLAAGISFMLQQGNEVKAQTFAAPVSNFFGIPYMLGAAFTDMDGDGDLDLWTIRWNFPDHGPLRYFENVGTSQSPQFDTAQVGPYGLDSLTYLNIDFADLDDDGDQDLLSGIFDFHENIGNATIPQFNAPIHDPFGLARADFYVSNNLVDLDADGDYDLLVAQSYYGNFVYYENVGTATSPQYPSSVNDPFGLYTGIYNVRFMSVEDLDGDGDYDILTTEFDYFRYFENVGTPTSPQFAAPVVQPFGLPQPSAFTMGIIVDIDGDGDGDILVDKWGTKTFHENISPLSTDELKNIDFSLYPNPTADIVYLENYVRLDRVEVYDMRGRLVLEKGGMVNEVNLNGLRDGMYLIRLIARNGAEGSKLIRKEIR